MPQASDELREIVAWIIGTEPQGVPDCAEVERWLQARGYHLQRDWTWRAPSKEHPVSEFEYLCIKYLVHEWDYGGFAQVEPSTPKGA